MKHLILLIFASLFFSNILVGQPNIIPPSPDASALGNYAYSPAVASAGIQPVTIPLYEIVAGSIKYPLSLNYHAGGIKVTDNASWVGLGWSLNGVGVITRSIRGKDDFKGGFYFVPKLPDSKFWNDEQLRILSSNGSTSGSWWCNDLEYMEMSIIRGVNNLASYYDTEADIFYYNFNGNSGTFYFNKGSMLDEYAVPIFQSATNFDIKFFFKENRWEIITADGIKYTFGTNEVSFPCGQVSTGLSGNDWGTNEMIPASAFLLATSSWYLDKIVSPQNDIIEFKYDNEKQATKSVLNLSEDHKIILSTSFTEGLFSSCGFHSTYCSAFTVTDNVYLKSIIFPNGQVQFSTSERKDLLIYSGFGIDWYKTGQIISPPQKLDKMTVQRTKDNFVSREIVFNSTYFDVNNYNTINNVGGKLKFNSLVINGIEKYSFAYINDWLPATTSNGIDHWGFYNGKENHKEWNTDKYSRLNQYGTRLPQMDFPTVGGQIPDTYYGVDRNPDSEKMQYGMLKEIVFPTGGKRVFTYEPNSYLDRVNELENHSYDLTLSKDDGLASKKTTFEITQTTNVNFDYNSVIQLSTSRLQESQNNTFCFDFPDPNLAIISKDRVNIKYINTKSYDYSENGHHCESRSSPIAAGYWVMNGNFKLRLEPGKYDIEVFVPDFGNGEKTIQTKLSLSYSYPNSNFVEKELIGGGVRIKEISDFDGKQTTTKKYLYTNNKGLTSGHLMSPVRYSYYERGSQDYGGLFLTPKPLYLYSYETSQPDDDENKKLIFDCIYEDKPMPICKMQNISACDYTCGVSRYISYIRIQSSGIFDLGASPNGNPVYYHRVLEVTSTINSSFQTIYNFRVIANNSRYADVPGTYSTSNGLVNMIEYKDDLGKTLKKVDYDYNVKYFGEVECLKLRPVPDTKYMNQHGFIRYYKNLSEWWYKTRETTTDFSYNYQGIWTGIATTKEFKYNDKNLLQNEIVENKGNSEEVTQKIYYPSDYTGDALCQSLVAKNIVESPIDQRTYKNGVLTNGAQFEYNSIGQIVNVFAFEGANLVLDLPQNPNFPYSFSQQESRQYDVNTPHRLVSTKSKDGINTIYYWGYNGQYPIAKIVNMEQAAFDSNSVLKQLLSQIETSTVSSSSADFKTLNNNIRAAVPSSVSIETFTYNPLQGLTSHTDQNGLVTFYQYDSSGRLRFITDNDGNLVKEFNYNYKH